MWNNYYVLIDSLEFGTPKVLSIPDGWRTHLKLKDMCIQNWQADLNISSSSINYRLKVHNTGSYYQTIIAEGFSHLDVGIVDFR